MRTANQRVLAALSRILPKRASPLYSVPTMERPAEIPHPRRLRSGARELGEFNQLELRSGSHDMFATRLLHVHIFTDDHLARDGRVESARAFLLSVISTAPIGPNITCANVGMPPCTRVTWAARAPIMNRSTGIGTFGGWADPGSPYDGDGSVWETGKSAPRRLYRGQNACSMSPVRRLHGDVDVRRRGR